MPACLVHIAPNERCMACLGRWDRLLAERLLREGYTTATLAATLAAGLRAAIAEIDQREREATVTIEAMRADAARHAEAVDGEHADGTACLECEVRMLRSSREADLAEAAATYEAMRAEIEALRCGDLVAFVDGELEPGRADAFRLHLGGCAICQLEIEGHAQLGRGALADYDTSRSES